jgi:hypothetical protein
MDSPPKNRTTNIYHIGPNYEQEQAMWDDFDGNFVFEASEAELHEEKRKEFDHRMEEYGLWGGLEALPDDDMINVEQLWQEDEQDDLLSELLEHTSASEFCRSPPVINLLYLIQTSTEGEKKPRMRMRAQTAPGFHIRQSWHFCWTQ